MMKKTVKKPSKKVASINHIKPLEDMMEFIKSSEVKLKKLVDVTLIKLEKSAKNAKTQTSKLTEKHSKIGRTIKAMQAKHKAKPSKMIHAAIKNLEKSQADVAKLLGCAKEEHATLQAQLATCKDMKKSQNTSNKSSHTKTTSKKSSAKLKKKVIVKKPETTTSENSTINM